MAYPQMYGAKTIEYKLNSQDGWKIDINDIRSKMDESVRLLVLINPNNPTGNVPTKQEIDDFISLARDFPRCTIISDEIYDGLDFSGNFVSLASRSQDVPVIVLNGVSKVYFAPGWRIGYMAWHDPSGSSPMLGMGLRDFSGVAFAHPLQHSTDISQDYRRSPIGWMDIVKK